jgi:hypothetical protein
MLCRSSLRILLVALLSLSAEGGSIALSGYHSRGMMTDGTIKCWGKDGRYFKTHGVGIAARMRLFRAGRGGEFARGRRGRSPRRSENPDLTSPRVRRRRARGGDAGGGRDGRK